MKNHYYFFLFTFLCTILSCGKEWEQNNENERNQEDRICVTSGCTDITETSATLSGYANLTTDMTGGVTLGFVISEEATPTLDNGVIKTTKELNPDNSFSVIARDLFPATSYYYRAFVKRNDVYMYGEIKSFKTQCVAIHLNQSSASVSHEGGTIHLEVTSPLLPNYSGLPDWIICKNSSYAENVYSITFEVLPNKSLDQRTAVIVFTTKGAEKDESFTIIQERYHVVLTERSDWSVRYVAREDWVNDDGSVDKVEHFQLSYEGSGYYIVRVIHPEDFKEAYRSDALAFFTYEAESLIAGAKKDGVNFWQYTGEVFDSKISDIYFKRMRSGTWTTFMIELDTKGNVTGNYAETSFTLRQETATESFSKWLGTWRASNGLLGYDLTISSIDNNFIYRIDGWERGSSVTFQMDQEYLEGEFWEQDGFLYIRSQYLGTYDDDDLGPVDELFMGNIMESGKLIIIPDEGIDLAVMNPLEGDNAELRPMEVTIVTDKVDHTAKFHSMQYYMWDHANGGWHPFNTNPPELPLTMIRLPGTRAESTVPLKQRSATKASIHRQQPEIGQRIRIRRTNKN